MDSTDEAAAAWAAQLGVRSCLRAARFAGGLRGAAATADVAAGGVLCEVPLEALITCRTVFASSRGPLLRRLGCDDDAALLAWTVLERGDPASPLGPLWRSLPRGPLGTGLTAPPAALRFARGTVAAEAERLLAAARAQHAQLQDALSEVGDPDAAAALTWPDFVAAVELWQAYGARVALPPGDGGGGGAASTPTTTTTTTTTTALLPVALLCNHAATDATVVRFGAPDADGVLRLRAARRGGRARDATQAVRRCSRSSHLSCPPLSARPVAAGDEVTLCYGRLCNAHLFAFYGFTLDANPFDELPLSLDAGDAGDDDDIGDGDGDGDGDDDDDSGDGDDGDGGGDGTGAPSAGAALRRHGLGADYSLRARGGLPGGLVAALRVLMDPRADPFARDGAADAAAARALLAVLDGVGEGLEGGEGGAEGEGEGIGEAREAAAWLHARRVRAGLRAAVLAARAAAGALLLGGDDGGGGGAG